MCQVQRVVNSCGHRNDHVLLACHIAKRSSGNIANGDTGCTVPSGAQLAIPVPATDVGSKNDTANGHHDSIPEDGFHACSEPYCIYGTVRTLDSPRGFKCMVRGCSTAD